MAGNIKGITIEFDGDVSKLQNSLKKTNDSIKKVTKNLKDVDKSLKFNPGNTELITQKQRYLGEQVSETKKKLEALKKVDENAKKQLANGKLGQEEYDKLRREIIETESKLEHFQGQVKKLDNTKLNNLAKSFQKISDKMKAVGDKIVGFGTSLSAKVTAPIVGIGIGAHKAWEEYDDAIDNIIKATGATGDAIKDFEGVYKDVFTSLPVESGIVSGAIGELNTQFGFTGDKLKEATSYMVKFSEITGQDTVSATQGAKKSMELFKLESDKLPDVLDRIAKVSQDTGVGTQQLFDAIQRGAPQIKAMGLNFDEGAILIGKFEKAGIDSNKALSYMTKAQSTFAKEGKNLSKGLEDIQGKMKKANTETDKLNILSKYFGTKGAPFMLEALESGALSFDDLAEASKNAKGTVSQTFEDTLDPVDKFKVAMNNLKTTASDLGGAIQETLAPIFEQLADKMKQLREWFASLSDEQKQLIVKIGLIAAAVGPLLVIVGKFITAVSPIFSGIGFLITKITALSEASGALAGVFSFISSHFLAIVSVIGVVVGAFVTLWNTNEEFRDNILGIWEIIRNTFSELISGIQERLGGLQEAFQNIIDFIWPIWLEFCNMLAPVFEAAFYIISEIFTAVKNTILGILDVFIGIFTGNWEQAWNGVKSIFESVWKAIENIITYVIESIGLVIEKGVNFISTTVTSVWNTLKSTVSGIWNAMGGSISAVWENIKSTVSGAVDGVKNTVTNVFNTLKNTVRDTWNGIRDSIWKPIQWAKDKVSGIVDAIKGFFNFKFSWPHIPMPHFGIKPKGWRIGDLLKGKIPSLGIDWYAQGGVFDRPSIIGVGEAGSETVLPTHKLDNFLASAVERVLSEININNAQSSNGGIVINVQEMNVRDDSDIKKVAKEVIRQIDLNSNRRINAGGLA